jgi:hypothetical protein
MEISPVADGSRSPGTARWCPGAAPLSSQRRQAPAGHHRPVPNQPVEYGASHQFAIICSFQLSAIFTKPSAGNAAAATNPHRRSSVHRFPAGSFFRGFQTPALYRIDRSCSGRHPKPFRETGAGPIPRRRSAGKKKIRLDNPGAADPLVNRHRVSDGGAHEV